MKTLEESKQERRKPGIGRCVWNPWEQGTYRLKPLPEAPQRTKRAKLSKNQAKARRRAQRK